MPGKFNGIITTGNREYDAAKIATINNAFYDLSAEQRAILLAQIIEESGGDPMKKSANGTYQGLLQWGADRYKIKSKDPEVELANQIAYLRKTLNDTIDGVSWTHGGKGSGYKSRKDTYGTFSNPEAAFDDRFRAFSYGYVRPQGKEDSYDNRLKVGHQVYDILKQAEAPTTPPINISIPPLSFPSHVEQPDALRVATPVVPFNIKAKGGSLQGNYSDWKKAIAKHRDIHPDEGIDYDYAGYYNKYPAEAWAMLNNDPEAHFTDEFKTVYHPTFSNQSKYSGIVDAKYNPQGITGGNWSNNNHHYTLSEDQARHRWDVGNTMRYMGIAEDNGVEGFYPDGRHWTTENGDIWGGVLPTVNVEGKKHAEGGSLNAPWNTLSMSEKAAIMSEAIDNGIYDLRGVKNAYHNNLFAGGGYMPSKEVRERIAQWEGDSMKTNRSFEAEAKDFNRVIPATIRKQLSQQQLDALYSYGYNVGMGALKQRVLPTLTNYINGSAGAEDVASSMWASRDSEPKMKGLRKRRDYERKLFVYNSPLERQQSIVTKALNADLSQLPAAPQQPIAFPPNPTDYGTPIDYSSPTVPVVEDTPVTQVSNNPLGLMNLMGMFGNTQQEAPIATYTPTQKSSSPYVVPTDNGTLFACGGHLFEDGGKRTHRFTYDRPIEYNGTLYPTQKMMVDDNEVQAFAADDGSIWSIGNDGKPQRVIYQHELPEVTVKPVPRITPTPREYLTMSNDATAIADGRQQNMHLMNRAIAGGKSHALWEKEHPNLAAWNYAAGAAPFAVASAPLAVGAGDMAAGTALGQGVTRGLTGLVNMAQGSSWLPWADAAATSAFGAHGLNEVAHGNVNPESLLEVAPLGRLARPMYNWSKGAYNSMQETYLLNKELRANPSQSLLTDLANKNYLERELTYGKNSGKVIHADFGNRKGAFTSSGAYIDNGVIFPGNATSEGQKSYTWWNADKPYSYGISNTPFTRYITTDEGNVPNILKVREQDYPIGQWNGTNGFVTSSERVTSSPTPLSTAEGLEYNPITQTYGRVRYVGQDSRSKAVNTAAEYPSFERHNALPSINKDVELGRQAFLEDVSSPWYKERWLHAGKDEATTDRILATMAKQAEEASFDLSKTTEQLGNNYGISVRNPKEVTTKLDSDENVVWTTTNYDTGMGDIMIASDAPEKYNTAYHELLHYTTNNSDGFSPNSASIMPKSPFDVHTDIYPNSHHTLRRGSKVYQDFILNQNERLLPKRSEYYRLAWEEPKKFKEVLINNDRTSAQAEELLKCKY